MDKFLKLETRRKVCDLLSKNPGLHLSKIAEMLNIRISLAEYHLLYMERNNIITAVAEKGYKRYFIESSMIGSKDKRTLAILRQENPLKIVLFLLENPNTIHKEILEKFDISKSTLSYHLKKLVKKGIISIQILSKEKTYKVINEKEIINLLIRFKPYAVLESFKDIWRDLKVE